MHCTRITAFDPLQSFDKHSGSGSLPPEMEGEIMDHQTFAQLLGNYGEFVGAVAVVITLIYLAIQVRHSKEATEAKLALRGTDCAGTRGFQKSD